jgi:hypothetical protein
MWADGGYRGELVEWEHFDIKLEIVKRNDKGFEVLPWRWIVERTFAWISRRMSKDYERLPKTTESWIYLAMTWLITRSRNYLTFECFKIIFRGYEKLRCSIFKASHSRNHPA